MHSCPNFWTFHKQAFHTLIRNKHFLLGLSLPRRCVRYVLSVGKCQHWSELHVHFYPKASMLSEQMSQWLFCRSTHPAQDMFCHSLTKKETFLIPFHHLMGKIKSHGYIAGYLPLVRNICSLMFITLSPLSKASAPIWSNQSSNTLSSTTESLFMSWSRCPKHILCNLKQAAFLSSMINFPPHQLHQLKLQITFRHFQLRCMYLGGCSHIMSAKSGRFQTPPTPFEMQ